MLERNYRDRRSIGPHLFGRVAAGGSIVERMQNQSHADLGLVAYSLNLYPFLNMPIPCKFKGYLLLGPDEGFQIGDFFNADLYSRMRAEDFEIASWSRVHSDIGPRFPGQSFKERHGTGFTVIRKATKKSGLPVRLVLHKAFSTPLPLP